MTTPGYDKRTRNSRAVTAAIRDERFPTRPFDETGQGWEKVEEVVSYRDDIDGQILLESQVDPYGYFIKRNQESKREHQRALRAIAEKSDKSKFINEFDAFPDTGHPFRVVVREGKTSINSEYKITDPFGRIYTATNLQAIGAEVTGLMKPTMLFPLHSNSFYSGIWQGPAYIPLPDPGGLDQKGKQAIKILAPGRPSTDFMRALGELVTGFPELPASLLFPDTKTGVARKGKRVKRVGDEYLNVQFGVAPTIGDMLKIADVLRNLSVKLLQLQRDNGRAVRRAMSFPTLNNKQKFVGTDLVANSGRVNSGTTYCGAPGGRSSGTYFGDSVSTQLSLAEIQRIWFSGSFSYFLPIPGSFAPNVERYLAELDRVVGLSLNPSNVYQLTPWTWLIDWAIDLKSALDLANIAFSDSLVINYGYAMRTTQRLVEQHSELTYLSGRFGPKYVHTFGSVTVKERIRANPYGFITESSGDWNPFRISILAALGLSKFA